MNTANTPDRLVALQMAFAGHIRDPENVPAPPGIEERRMNIYRELFFNNVKRILSGNFPVLQSLYGDANWSQLVREFYVEHRAQTPLFPELPREFLRYVQDQRQQRQGDPPFLLELAHYEWVELALSLDQRELQGVPANPEGNLLEGIPVLSPLAWPLSYRFPVHRITPDFQPVEAPAEATHLLVYRDRADAVKFMQLNDVTRLFLALLQENADQTGRRLLEMTAAQIGHRAPAAVIEGGAQLMQDLHSRDVLLGTRPDAGSNWSAKLEAE